MNYIDIKKNLKQIPARVYILALVFVFTIFLLLLDSNRMYKSTISILIISKSEIAASQIEEINSNAVHFPKMLSFFERMLRDNSDIKDFTQGHTPDERKELWNKYLEVSEEKSGAKNIINISIYAKKQADSETLSKKTAQTLFSVMSGYYNVKTDLDMRIIEGPISSTIVFGMIWIVLFSMISGLMLAYLVHIITEKFSTLSFNINGSQIKNALQKISNPILDSKKQNLNSIEDLYLPEELEAIKNEKVVTEKTSEVTFEEKIKEEAATIPSEPISLPKMQYPNFPEMPIRQVIKTTEAPDNLPIFDGYSLQFSDPKQAVSNTIFEEKKEVKPIKQPEPSQEEIKKRLNALLNGKI
jgi:hypothetical protein